MNQLQYLLKIALRIIQIIILLGSFALMIEEMENQKDVVAICLVVQAVVIAGFLNEIGGKK